LIIHRLFHGGFLKTRTRGIIRTRTFRAIEDILRETFEMIYLFCLYYLAYYLAYYHEHNLSLRPIINVRYCPCGYLKGLPKFEKKERELFQGPTLRGAMKNSIRIAFVEKKKEIHNRRASGADYSRAGKRGMFASRSIEYFTKVYYCIRRGILQW